MNKKISLKEMFWCTHLERLSFSIFTGWQC